MTDRAHGVEALEHPLVLLADPYRLAGSYGAIMAGHFLSCWDYY
jgi:hypothetical protein